MKGLRILAAALAAIPAVTPAESPPPGISTADAMAVFARAHALCEADGGRLWGVSLCVPIMLVDPNTRQAVANAALPGSTRDGAAFRLTLPASAEIANSPTMYAGVYLAELSWPLYGAADMQAVTLMHESFHIVQPKLGFGGFTMETSISGDAALDTENGRIWLRGELAALRAALQAAGDARKQKLRDALEMRLYRQSLFAGSAELERQQDVLEGLAEGTGIDAGLPPDRRIGYALFDMAFVEEQPSYARAFPYATGPAYTELLDAAAPGWRRRVASSSDIAQMTMRAYGLSLAAPAASQAQAIIARYGGDSIRAQEAARAVRKAALAAKYQRELVAGSTIALPLKKFSVKFNPRDIETFEPYGSVYHTLSVSAAWGTLDVSGGEAMISTDFHSLRVAAPPRVVGNVLRGEGWTLTLAAGYRLVADPQKSGSYTVAPQASR